MASTPGSPRSSTPTRVTLGYHQTVWTAPLLVRYLRDHHGVEVSGTTVGRAIARLGIRWKRPRHQLARRPDTWRQSKGG